MPDPIVEVPLHSFNTNLRNDSPKNSKDSVIIFSPSLYLSQQVELENRSANESVF